GGLTNFHPLPLSQIHSCAQLGLGEAISLEQQLSHTLIAQCQAAVEISIWHDNPYLPLRIDHTGNVRETHDIGAAAAFDRDETDSGIIRFHLPVRPSQR